VDRLENHPIRQMYDAGITVTVNSDDPPMFGTTLNREYEIAAQLLDLDETGIAALAGNAVRASYLDEGAKTELLGQIGAYLAAVPDQPCS
jgi:aminodeoxyfutalosine deaminase